MVPPLLRPVQRAGACGETKPKTEDATVDPPAHRKNARSRAPCRPAKQNSTILPRVFSKRGWQKCVNLLIAKSEFAFFKDESAFPYASGEVFGANLYTLVNSRVNVSNPDCGCTRGVDETWQRSINRRSC